MEWLGWESRKGRTEPALMGALLPLLVQCTGSSGEIRKVRLVVLLNFSFFIAVLAKVDGFTG
ncbi:hypothetical protein [Photobacterium halotolerans]|uniref:Uncharacterized protein n=1 Tax=Photobacterium halotolerans TaxID=265726 RepID=A0A7X5B0G1_9GAMM|nr:hypothetical protein [Photobacterium halotolerans]NAW63797.1 hypothetical protein [Photobacterium halotolerans]NAW87213.1 hypothetical protein [Photobacterium halotolerans]NAX46724.1 hypothetical protein [Photobacterium halotolerans]